jgi:tetratricopeptide (TPR) repeat protein
MISQSQKKIVLFVIVVILIGSFILLSQKPERVAEKPVKDDFRQPPVSSAPSTDLSLKEKIYLESLKEDPGNARLHAELGDLYFENKRYVQAIEEYRRAIAIDPVDADSYNDLGLALHYTGKSDEAIKTLKKGTEANSSYQRVWLSYGFILASTGNREEAKPALEKAISLGPDTDMGSEAKRILALLKESQ